MQTVLETGRMLAVKQLCGVATQMGNTAALKRYIQSGVNAKQRVLVTPGDHMIPFNARRGGGNRTDYM